MTDFNKTLRWAGTTSYLIGMVTTSLNFFPLNLWFHLGGGVLWTWAALGVSDKPLLVIEVAAVLTYTSGLIYAGVS